MNHITRPIPGLHDPEVSKLDRYTLCWDHLLHLPEATAEQRYAAYIWLGYRVVEGEVKFEDWHGRGNIEALRLQDEQSQARWQVALHCVDIYARLLCGTTAIDGIVSDILSLRAFMERSMAHWPNIATSYLRMQALAAYARLMHGDKEGAEAIVSHAFDTWQGLWHRHDPFKPENHYRFAEMAYDCAPLHAMMCMTVDMREEWSNRVLDSEKDFPWWKCILKIGAGNPLAVWGRVFDTRQEMARALFRGKGMELGVAAGAFSADILQECPQVKWLALVDKWDDDRHPLAQYWQVIKRFRGNARAQIVRATFASVAPLVPDESLDFCYIDGYAHTGQESGQTLREWLPKVKPGGIFAGHDFHPDWPLTVEAVRAFAAEHRLILNLTREERYPSWWCTKP